MAAAANIQIARLVSEIVIDVFQIIHVHHDNGKFHGIRCKLFVQRSDFSGVCCLGTDAGQRILVGFLPDLSDLLFSGFQPALTLCHILNAQIGAAQSPSCIPDLSFCQFVIEDMRALFDGALELCFRIGTARITEFLFQVSGCRLKTAASDVRKSAALLVCPEAVSARIKNIKCILQIGNNIRQNTVQHAERPVKDRKVVDHHTEYAVSEHGAVDRIPEKDVVCLHQTDADHGREDHGVPFADDLRRSDREHSEHQDHGEEHAVIHDAVNRLSPQGNQLIVGKALDIYRSDLKGMAEKRVQHHLYGIQHKKQIRNIRVSLVPFLPPAVFIREIDKRTHYKVHAEIIEIVSDHCRDPAARCHDQQIAEHRRDQSCFQKCDRIPRVLVGMPRQKCTDQKCQYQNQK